MTDEGDALAKTTGAAAIATLAALDPTQLTGIAVAALSAVAANYSTDRRFREAGTALLFEIVVEEQDARKEVWESTQDEFERHRLTLEWLQEELERLHGRVEGLEAVAASIMLRSEGFMRAHPDPNMRPFLSNALRNMLRRSDEFPAGSVARISRILDQLSYGHLKILTSLYERCVRVHVKHGTLTAALTAGEVRPLRVVPQKRFYEELKNLSLVHDIPHSPQPVDKDTLTLEKGQEGFHVTMFDPGVQLVEFVTPPRSKPC